MDDLKISRTKYYGMMGDDEGGGIRCLGEKFYNFMIKDKKEEKKRDFFLGGRGGG